jgi:ribonuclease-3
MITEDLSPGRKQAILKFLSHPFWAITTLSDTALLHYHQALTHDSFTKEQLDRGIACLSYERLEFLGDRILNHAVAEFLFQQYPDAEGVLSNKIQFTKNENLAKLVKAKDLGIQPPLVRLGKGQNLEDSTIADVFEALIAAIYLDPSYGMAKIHAIIREQLADAIHAFQAKHENSKEALQIYVQKHLRTRQLSKADLDYVLISDQLEANNRHTFTVEVKILGRPWGRGQGSNKVAAEQAAARAALSKIEAGDSPF